MTETQDAYADWTDALAEAGEAVEAAASEADTLERAEGLRYLTRLATMALWTFVEHDDPMWPTLYTNTDEYKKFGFDNPDNRYHRASLRDDQTYRLWGRRGEAPYVGLSFGADLFTGTEGGPRGTLAQHHLDEYGILRGDEFDLALSGTSASGGTEISLPPGTTGMIVRETFFDKTAQEPSDLRIERVGATSDPPPLDAETTATRLRRAAGFIRTVAPAFLGLRAHLASRPFELEGVAGRDTMHLHGDPDLYYASSWWVLAADEAMVVTVEPADEFTYWGFQLSNSWLESLDYRYLPVATNNGIAARAADGTWKIVVAHENPGSPNRLTTAGHGEGGMCFRWLLASEDPPLPRIEVVKLADLRETE